ncbi:MAG: hypothetical protein F6K41_23095 [Symploca sp. SIO3E6]|nr:hypothetical protein [Caldora sp. SIO3E6]
MNEVRFPYKPGIVRYLFAIIFFIIFAVFFAFQAQTNEKDFILNGIIKLSVEGTASLYWCCAIVGVCFVTWFTLILITGSRAAKEIILTEREIAAPKNKVSNKIVSVKYSQIYALKIYSYNWQRHLCIAHHGGELYIIENMLPSKEAFERLIQLVSTRANVQCR